MSTLAETATLVHGFSMARIDRLTRRALRMYGRGHILGWEDRYEAAWFAIVEHLYISTDPPEESRLLQIGCFAVQQEIADLSHHHGFSRSIGAEGANFTKYWTSKARLSEDDFTAGLIERMALPQVLAALTDAQYEAISALAAFGTHKAAAAALGIHVETFGIRIRDARAQVAALWIAPETPHTFLRNDKDYCPRGHSRAVHAFINNKGTSVCRICQRAAGRASDRRRRERAREKRLVDA